MGTYKPNYDELLLKILPLMWRRRGVPCCTLFAVATAAFLFYAVTGERYEGYTLLRIGQGIKERTQNSGSGPFGDGIDLAARIDSVARIGLTDHGIREAAIQVGYGRLQHTKEATLFAKAKNAVSDALRSNPTASSFMVAWIDPWLPRAVTDANEPGAAEIAHLRNQISARQEGRSDLLRISFRYPDPDIAARFVNELASSLVTNYADLVQVPGAESFFQHQAKRLEQAAEKAATDLRAFSVSASIYAVADQRSLLLKRLNDFASQLAATRGSIEEKKGQKQAIMDQLMILRPVYQSRTVTGIVKNLGGRHYRSDSDITEETATSYGESPPLLLIRVYQDNMAALMKVNADLKGAQNLEKMLGTEIEHVNAELAELSSKEAEHDRLKRVLARASDAAEKYGSRTIEEQINSDIAKKAQLSSVRIVQIADRPVEPVFPQIMHLVALAVIGGLASGAAIVLFLELGRSRQTGYGYGRVVQVGRRRRDDMLHAAE